MAQAELQAKFCVSAASEHADVVCNEQLADSMANCTEHDAEQRDMQGVGTEGTGSLGTMMVTATAHDARVRARREKRMFGLRM